MFEIKELSPVEATAPLAVNALSCALTWGGVYLLYIAACC